MVVEHVTQVEGHMLGDVLIEELCAELKPAAGNVNGDHDQGSEQQVVAVSPDETTIHDLFEQPRHREVGRRRAQEAEIGEAGPEEVPACNHQHTPEDFHATGSKAQDGAVGKVVASVGQGSASRVADLSRGVSAGQGGC